MAYDEALADRVRAILSDEFGVTEQKMFGGLAFMLRGNMCCGVLGDDLILRLGPERVAAAVEREGLGVMDFTGRPMKAFALAEPPPSPPKPSLAAGWPRRSRSRERSRRSSGPRGRANRSLNSRP